MQQVREVAMVSQEMEDTSSWVWLILEQMGFPLRSEFSNQNRSETGTRNNAITSMLNKLHIF